MVAPQTIDPEPVLDPKDKPHRRQADKDKSEASKKTSWVSVCLAVHQVTNTPTYELIG